MRRPLVVLDTNVLVAATRSRRGASFALLSKVGDGGFGVAVGVPLVLEYEDVLLRHRNESGLSVVEVGALLDYICSVAKRQEVFFLWRPTLRDPRDDMVLELAVAARADAIVTFNTRDFSRASSFGVEIMMPLELLEHLRGVP